MKIRLANPLQTESIVDGPGFRAVVWTQGCHHDCEGCHNPQTHDKTAGKAYETETIKEQISDLKLHKGITLSGGEPFNQPRECLDIATHAISIGYNVWCYTGYEFEFLLNEAGKDMKDLLKQIDVLIDGKFEFGKKNLLLRYRGSSNQRVIDVKKSLEKGEVVTLHFDGE